MVENITEETLVPDLTTHFRGSRSLPNILLPNSSKSGLIKLNDSLRKLRIGPLELNYEILFKLKLYEPTVITSYKSEG